MTPGGTSEFKELVRSRTDLADLVGETIALSPKRGGSDYVGLCPFHEDRNPSFHVYPDRQSWRCWVCDEGGDCFSYVMKIEGVGFREALEMLARRANLELPRAHRRGGNAAGDTKNRLYEVLGWAERELHRFLIDSPAAAGPRDYLAGRGFETDSLVRYGVGYHPNDWSWLLNGARGRFTPRELLAARLVRERRDGSGYYDDFVDRVTFPIRDTSGRPVAFGGRILPGHPKAEVPKYLNSPESALFSKSRLLYGFDVAKEAIRRSETAIVVEGYTDCIMLHQHGVQNVVGTLGTSLTESHVTALRRFARKVVLVYDGDQAGQSAAERSLAKFLAQQVDLRLLTLPAGQDPADFLSQFGGEAFCGLVDDSIEAWEQQLRLSIGRYGLETTDGRHRVLDDMLRLLAQAPGLSGTLREDLLLSRLSQRAGINEQTVRQQLTASRKKQSSGRSRRLRVERGGAAPQQGAETTRVDKHNQLESELVGIIFRDPELVETCRQEIPPEDFRNEPLRRILQLCYDLSRRHVAPSAERVIAELEEPELKRLAVRIDDFSREHEIERKLKEDNQAGSPPGSTFFRQTIQGLKWRRSELSHEASKGQMAGLATKPGSLDDEAKALLRQAAEFHKERVKKRT